jgi:tetratricopeptide (TPR) repeat protein
MAAMQEDIVLSAMESADPAIAEKALHEIDIQLQSLADADQCAGLLLRKAVLYGVFKRFGDAREQIDLALKQHPTDSNFQLNVDFVKASLYDQEGLPDKALVHLTALLSAHAKKLALPEFRNTYEDIQHRRALDSVCVGEYSEAIPLLHECLSFDLQPEARSIILCKLGDCYSHLRNYESARDSFLAASEIGLTKEWAMQAHCQLGIAYGQLDCLPESKRELQLCEELERDQFPMRTVYEWLSFVCKRLGEKAESDRYFRLAQAPDKVN